MLRFLLSIDRRVIFLLVLAAVVLGTLFPDALMLPIKPSRPVRGIYEAVDELPERAPFLLSMDFDPASAPELEPMARAILRHAFSKGLRAIGMTHWPGGLALAEQIMKETAMEFDAVVFEAARAPTWELAAAAAEALRLGAPAEPVLRLLAFGNPEEARRLFNRAQETARAGEEGGGGARAGGPDSEGAARSERQAAFAALAEAAAAIPPEKALPRRTVNFGRDRAPLDRKNKARDLLWHLPAGQLAPEPVPVVGAGGDVVGWEIVRVVERIPTVVYGRDWCFLGYKAGGAILIIAMGQNLHAAFPTDNYGTPIREIAALQGVRSLADLKYMVALAAGDTGESWIVYGSGRYGFAMGVGCTAVMAPDLYPYYGSKQITGIAGGIKGAWEYETLVNVRGRATDNAPVQTVAHLLVMALIVFCNVAYFVQRLAARGSR